MKYSKKAIQLIDTLLSKYRPDRYYPKEGILWMTPGIEELCFTDPDKLSERQLRWDYYTKAFLQREKDSSRAMNAFFKEHSKGSLFRPEDYNLHSRFFTLAFEHEYYTKGPNLFGKKELLAKKVKTTRVPLPAVTPADYLEYIDCRLAIGRTQKEASHMDALGARRFLLGMSGKKNMEEWLRPLIEQGVETIELPTPDPIQEYTSIDAEMDAACHERSGGYCECTGECGDHVGVRCTRAHEETHHLTYRRFGREELEDLLGVCRSCHPGCDKRRGRGSFVRPFAVAESSF